MHYYALLNSVDFFCLHLAILHYLLVSVSRFKKTQSKLF